MSNLAKEALEMIDALAADHAALQALVLKACAPEKHDALWIEFRNLRTRLGQIRARVPGAIVCDAVQEPPTLAEIQRQHAVPHVPACPERALVPPPTHYVQGLTD